MLRLFTTLICSLSVGFLFAQNLDSLYTLWQDSGRPDSIRVAAYKDFIQRGFLYSRPDTTLVLAEELHRYAKEYDYPKAAAEGYRLQGIANAMMGDFPSAKEYFTRSQASFESIGDRSGVANSLKNIGNVYLYQGNRPRALAYAQQALSIYEVLGDKEGIAGTLNNLGHIYWEQENYPLALEYAQKSLAIYEELGDKAAIAGRLSNLGNIYMTQKNYPLALEYNQKALNLYEELGNKNGIANIRSNNGAIYFRLGDRTRALEYAQQSLAIYKELGNKGGIAGDLTNMGTIYNDQGKPDRARRYCQDGLVLAEEIGVLEHQKNACKCLYNAYKALGRGSQALEYLEKMRVLEDSLKANETAEKLQQMEFEKIMLQDSIAQAEEARRVEEAHQQEVRRKNQTRNVFIGSSMFLFLLAGGLYSRWRYVRKAKTIIEKEKDRSENLLLNILPAEIAEELKEKGRAEARDFEMVSILFTDFKGFTEQSAKLSAAELVQEINHCFEAFDGIIEKYGIEKIKTIGDAYMAAGGLPVPTDDSVKNTVLAALEMQAFIRARKAENEASNRPAFEMRVGIHTGPVVAGIVGVKKFQYDIWGDTVNTASRMESSGAVGKVNISEATYELVKDAFRCEYRGEIEVKGKGKLGMYFVKGPAG